MPNQRGARVKSRDSLKAATVELLRSAGALEQQAAIQDHMEASARAQVESNAFQSGTYNYNLRATKRALVALKPVPNTPLIASMKTQLQRVVTRDAAMRKDFPLRNTRRPAQVSHLIQAMAKAIAGGESRTQVVRYVMRELLPQIPYLDSDQLTEYVLLERLRKRKK